MHSNKCVASWAKEIAERKLLVNSVTGAKEFGLEAQNLYPGLEGMPQLIATIDVFVAAENRINGEIDWYGILGVNPRVNYDTIRKQYGKLALLIRPDKNKSIGANDAFKLVYEAWDLLSDNSKRAAYDQKRNSRAFRRGSAPAPAPAEDSAPAPSGSSASMDKGAVPQTSTNKGKGYPVGPILLGFLVSVAILALVIGSFLMQCAYRGTHALSLRLLRFVQVQQYFSV